MSVVIAIDGTAACGKGTLARALSRHFGFPHLDSGALYRLTAIGVLEAGGTPSREDDAVRAAHAIDPARASDPQIRTEIVGKAASVVAAIPGVRAALLKFQQDFAGHPPEGARGAVIDGRDVGTVIAPQAQAKLFIDARPEVRALRRQLELQALGLIKPLDVLVAELNARDAADRGRAVSPLRRAEDADLLDTSDLGIEPAFKAALALVEPKVELALANRHRG
jgi:cytidylate kinase